MDTEKVVFIDANIFLEVILDDEKSTSCETFLKKVLNQEILAKTSDFIIYTCLLQIQQKLKSRELMNRFILFINELKGLEIIRPSLKEMYNAAKISEKHNLDFDDSLVISRIIANDIKTLISFDKHFDKIKSIDRKEPNLFN